MKMVRPQQKRTMNDRMKHGNRFFISFHEIVPALQIYYDRSYKYATCILFFKRFCFCFYSTSTHVWTSFLWRWTISMLPHVSKMAQFWLLLFNLTNLMIDEILSCISMYLFRNFMNLVITWLEIHDQNESLLKFNKLHHPKKLLTNFKPGMTLAYRFHLGFL